MAGAHAPPSAHVTTDMSAEPPEEDPAPAKFAEIVQNTYDYMPTALSGYLAGVAVATLLYWDIAPKALILPWIAADRKSVV